MNQPQAFLSCRCGACRITLCDPTVRAHVECLCVDCRQRALISASRHPDNSLPEAVANFERGVHLMYFANAFIIDDDSAELLEFSKLTEEGANTTAMSTCCGTLMCGVNPLYDGATISVNADSCVITTPSRLPVQFLSFANDIPEDKAAEIVHSRSLPVFFDAYAEMESPTMQAFVKSVTEPISATARSEATTNFEQLSAAKPILIDNSFYRESRRL